MIDKKENESIYNLMLKLLNDTATQNERKELAQHAFFMKDEELMREIEKVWKTYKPLTEMPEEKSISILNNILKEKERKKLARKKRLHRQLIYTLSAAASIGILIVLSFFMQYNAKNQAEKIQPVLVEAPHTSPESKAGYTRNYTLPDGSNVILQENSVIRFVNDFTGNTREISLEGQAFFDIAPNREKPFIIHTGSIKTTVLGTVFNIKALPEEKKVTVSVKRGKVKVEDEKHLLAVLTESQELHCSKVETKTISEPVTVEENVTEWIRKDLNFDHVPLRDVALTLSKRYEVTIEIAGKDLADSEIVAFFGGTESLEGILKVLCAINSKTHYEVKDDKKIVITSKEN